MRQGLNFSRAKHTLVNSTTFIPHIRSNFQAAMPIEILDNLRVTPTKDLVALLKIKSKGKEIFRIKNLSKASNSLIVSLKAEKTLKDLQINVLGIKPAEELQARTEPIITNNKLNIYSILPKFTKHCSWPEAEQRDVSPIYLFPHKSKVHAGIKLSRKDLVFNKEIELNELTGAAIGLYFAEGGKFAPSFTNSQPKIINTFLDFIEKISNINRKELRATINCSEEQAIKKSKLEEFWSAQTGIKNFNKLHIGKHVKSPSGILEVNLGSVLIKELMCNLFTIAPESKLTVNGLIRGLLSGDGSPILQHKNYITHHIATDKNYIRFQQKFIEKVFRDKISTIRKINDGKIVLYNKWLTNLDFLLFDPYKFNIFNRKKFADKFLNMPTTKAFLNSESSEIFNTLKDFIKNTYPKYVKEVEEFNKTLMKFNLK